MLTFLSRHFATKASATVTKNKKDSAGKRLGIKAFSGEEVRHNDILVRQRGLRWRPGYNVHIGRDHTVHASVEGVVLHGYDEVRKRVTINVVPWKIPERPRLLKPFCFHPELFPDRAALNPPPGDFWIKPEEPRPVKVKFDKGTALASPKYKN
jgi:large subunit ribosomal protein L27